MDWPEELIQLTPIFDILSFECLEEASNEVLYRGLPDLLVPILIGKIENEEYCFSQVIRLCYNRQTNEVEICAGYPDVFVRCPRNGYRFNIYFIDLVFLKSGRIDGRHSEALLIDNNSRTIEFFEPNGADVPWYPTVNSLLQYKFSRILPNYKFLSTGEFCPLTGPQAISKQDICGSFSLLFILLRVYNPEVTSHNLTNILTRLSKIQIQQLMRQFICYIRAFSQERNFRQLQNLYDDLYMRVINEPNLFTLLDTIYYSLDYTALQQYQRDLETKGLTFTNNIIYFYSEKDPYGEFSNYYYSPFIIDSINYPTVEHYLQVQKFMGPNTSRRNLEYAQLILSQNIPIKVNILGNRQIKSGYNWIQELNNIIRSYQDVIIRPDWEDLKDNIIRKGIFNKFLNNVNVLKVLLNTGENILVEHTSKDNYWGDGGNGEGQNKLGKILMETRDIFRYTVIPVGQKNYWLIRNILLIGYIDVTILNNVGVKYILDLSGSKIVSQKILGECFVDPISVYQGQIIFVSPPEGSSLEQLADLTIQSLGKGYVSYIYATGEKYIEFIPILLSRLYEIPMDLARELVLRLLQK